MNHNFNPKVAKEYGIEEAKNRIYVTTDKAKGALKTLATEEEYETITQEKPVVKYRFKIAELWSDLWE